MVYGCCLPWVVLLDYGSHNYSCQKRGERGEERGERGEERGESVERGVESVVLDRLVVALLHIFRTLGSN